MIAMAGGAGDGGCRLTAHKPWAGWWPACLTLAGALPLLVTRPAPLQDWPNHVARVHILRALLDGDGFWTQFYRFSGFLVPNAALDLGILGLSRLGIPVGIAAQLFLLATYGAFVAGFCALARALGADGPIKPAFAVLLFYGNALFWGLVNYVLGVGLMLGLLALWLGSARYPVVRLAIAALGAALLLFTHVVVALAWVVLLAGFDLYRFAPRGRHLVARALGGGSWPAALLMVAALLAAMPGASDLHPAYVGSGIGWILVRKLELLFKVLLGGSLLQDAASLLALLCCFGAASLSRPRLAAAPLLVAGSLLAVMLGAPERIGSGSVLDTRLAMLPLLLLAAAVRLSPGRIAIAAASCAVLARTLVLAGCWHSAGLVFGAFRAQTAGLPAGSVMMAAYGTRLASLSWQQVWSPAITSIATQAVFAGLFVPSIFANPAQQPIALRGRWRGLGQPWNLSDPASRRASAATLAWICAEGRFAGVYLTLLYPGAAVGRAPDFLVLDACALRQRGFAPLNPIKGGAFEIR